MTKNIVPVFLTLLLATSCKEKKQSAAAPAGGPQTARELQVDGTIIRAVSISETVEVTGNILPFEATEIRPEISGRVVHLNLREGGIVPKGTLLVKLFDGDLQAQLKKLVVQLQIAEKTEERQRELVKISGISQQDYDLSLLAVNNIKADIELVRVAITKTEVRAPYTGRLGLRNISPGAYISPTTLVTTISQVSQKKVEFSIPEKYSAQIRNGMEVNFTTAGSGSTYTATIAATESAVEENTRNLRVRAIVRGSDQNLVPGNFAKVRVVLGRNNNAIMIPSSSIIPVARSKQVVVYRGGGVSFQNVETGIRDSTSVQVLDGLVAGDTLITSGLLFLRPDSKVKLSQID